MKNGYTYNDGGRETAGFKGKTGDCVTRAISIAARLPYREVYDRLAAGHAAQRASKRTAKQSRTARNGIYTKRKWFKDYMRELGFEWVATMGIGTGCKVHLVADELPTGRLVVHVSKHSTAMIDGVINDTYDPRREVHNVRWDVKTNPPTGNEWLHERGDRICSISRRCVYGYWIYKGVDA